MPIHEQSSEPPPAPEIPPSPEVTSSPGPIGPAGPTIDMPTLPSHNQRDGLRSILSTLAILIIAPLLAFSLTAFVFQSYEVDGPSMQTTLQNHDRLIVLKLPRTLAKITGHPYVPHRTDIIIFTKSDLYDFGTTQQRQLVKRVIGLPGDRVVVQNGILTIYNSAHPNGFQPDKVYSYGKVIVTTPGNIDITVPAGQIFVCGDNRPDSLDSRSFGPIPVKDVVGKLSLRIFPFNKAESF